MSTKAQVTVSTDTHGPVTIGDLRKLLAEIDEFHLSDDLMVWTADGVGTAQLYVSLKSTETYPILCGNHKAYDDHFDVVIATHECD